MPVPGDELGQGDHPLARGGAEDHACLEHEQQRRAVADGRRADEVAHEGAVLAHRGRCEPVPADRQLRPPPGEGRPRVLDARTTADDEQPLCLGDVGKAAHPPGPDPVGGQWRTPRHCRDDIGASGDHARAGTVVQRLDEAGDRCRCEHPRAGSPVVEHVVVGHRGKGGDDGGAVEGSAVDGSSVRGAGHPRRNDRPVPRAAADVAGQPDADHVGGEGPPLSPGALVHPPERHHDAGGTEAALCGEPIDDGLLNRMEATAPREILDGEQRGTVQHRHEQQAGVGHGQLESTVIAGAPEDHGAGAAVPLVAALLRAGRAARVAQPVKDGRRGGHAGDLDHAAAVPEADDVRHEPPPRRGDDPRRRPLPRPARARP